MAGRLVSGRFIPVRAAVALVFSCLLLWVQAVAALSPCFVAQAAPCPCCSCSSRACCPPQTNPAPAPSPTVASRVGTLTESLPAPMPAVVAAPSPSVRSSSSFSPRIAFSAILAPPLFLRHRALLI